MNKTFTTLLVIIISLIFHCHVIAQQHLVLDRTFGETCGFSQVQAITPTPFEVFKMPDGKYMVVGESEPPNYATSILFIRFNADGTIDSSFGTNGIKTNSFDQVNRVRCIVFENNHFYVAGYQAPGTAASTFRASLSKFLIDATPDSTFNQTGNIIEATGTNPISSSFYTHLVIQPDEKVVAFGFESNNINGGAPIVIARRYNTDGSADATFNPSVVYNNLALPTSTYHSKGVLSADGSMRFMYLDNLQSTVVTVKLDSTGAPVSSYGTNGQQSNPATNVSVNYLRYKELSNGSLLGMYSKSNANLDIHLFSINPSGNFDSTFSADGNMDIVDYPGTNASETPYVLHVDGQNRIWTMGNGSFAWGEPKGIFYRLDAAGNYDTNLEGTGYGAITEIGSTQFRAATFDNDNSLVIATLTSGNVGLLKLIPAFESIAIQQPADDTVCIGSSVDIAIINPTDCYTYYWIKDNVAFADTNQTTINITEGGTYKVIAIFNNDTLTSNEVSIVFEVCTSVEQLSNVNSTFTVTPNPAKDIITIHSNHAIATKYYVSDVCGRIIKEVVGRGTAFTIDVSDLQPGIYFLNTDNNKAVRKLIINR